MGKQLLMAVWLGFMSAVNAAERPCAPYTQLTKVVFLLPYDDTCYVTNHWAVPMDLDGDGVGDFSHERLRAERHLTMPGGVSAFYQDDEIEAFYPEDHVEMYVFSLSGAWMVPAQQARLQYGQVILPEPRTKPPWVVDWQWGIPTSARPTYDALGVGILYRHTQLLPCSSWTSHIDCNEGTGYAGYMAPVNEYGLRTDELTKDGLFGFRIKRADGWHLGWMWLYWEYDSVYSHAPTLEIVDSAVHPEPGTAIAAGMAPRPKLAARRAGEELVLSWATVWKGYTLERSQTLGATVAWTEVPGVVDNIVRVPGPPGTVFFRLRQP